MAQKFVSQADTWFGILIICVGLVFAAFGIYNHFNDITPENQLVMAEGVPQYFSEEVIHGKYEDKYMLSFSVKDLHTHITSLGPNAALPQLLKNGGPIQLYVSPKQESLIPDHDMPLYKLVKDGNTLISYEQTVSHKTEDQKYYWIGSAIFIVMGLTGLLYKQMTENEKKNIPISE